MIRAAIVGLGWWGKTQVEAVQGSDKIKFVAATTRSLSEEAQEFCKQYDMELKESYEAILADPEIDAVVLVTPNSLHAAQTIAAVEAGKHVFVEKPFALNGAEAQKAIEAAKKAGRTVGIGYSRRFHPEMTALKEKVKNGDLGTILHIESTMTFPNALYLKPGAWRADKSETPCGGLTPMGVHAIDGMIDMVGEIDQVYCQSFRRAVEVDADDTTSILFRMKNGCSAYLGTMTATGGGFNFKIYGSKGYIQLDGMTHIAGAPSEERRMQLFSKCTFKPVKGPAEVWDAAKFDVVNAALEDFAEAAESGKAYLVSPEEIVHGSAVTEAIVKSAAQEQAVKVEKF